MKQAKNPVKTVETSIEILSKMKDLDSATVTTLAEELDYTAGTIHSHLATLEENHFVVKNDDGEFQLGIRFFEIGEDIRKQKTIYEVGVSEVDKLAEETGDIGSMLIEEHGRGVYLYRARGEQALHLDTEVGSRVHLHNTGLGKAILAHMPSDRVEDIIDQYGLPKSTPNTITDPNELFDELETIREQGYALDRQERADGVFCVAAPVLTNQGEVLSSVSVAGPVSRMNDKRHRSDVQELVQNVAKVIGINASYV
jgi:DNA-binding IclR family transcriptional regulator